MHKNMSRSAMEFAKPNFDNLSDKSNQVIVSNTHIKSEKKKYKIPKLKLNQGQLRQSFDKLG